jgi:molybdate-binding protein
VTFASWEQGLIVQRGNPKQLRAIEDLARRTVTLINREPGSGARLLLDHHMTRAGLRPEHVRGYDRLARSHLEVARAVAEGRADVGIGVLAAARLLGLDFIPLQHERYDLVLPTSYLSTHRALSVFLDALVSQPFRSELMALGGYETTETGKVHVL